MQHDITGVPTPTFSGSIDTRRVDLDRFHVMEARFPPDMRCGEHYHDKPSLAVVMDGSISKDYRRGGHDSLSNSVYSTPAGEPHSLRVGPRGMHLLILEPVTPDLRLLAPFESLFDRVTTLPLSPVPILAWQVATELRRPDDLTPMVIDGLVSAVLAAVARGENEVPAPRGRPGWLGRVEQRIRDDFRSSTSIAELASEVGVHPVHMTRVFREHYGVTPGTYVRSLRIQWAASQLAATDTPLRRVAQLAGFADQSHFTRAFKQLLGTTPGRYRNEIRG